VYKSFNSDFYVVCATVIPVLFLALAVQGDSYQALLDASLKAAITKAKAKAKAGDGWRGHLRTRVWSRFLQVTSYYEDYRKLNSKKYRPMAARKESRNVLSGRR
jgi:hypothetical protein